MQSYFVLSMGQQFMGKWKGLGLTRTNNPAGPRGQVFITGQASSSDGSAQGPREGQQRSRLREMSLTSHRSLS